MQASEVYVEVIRGRLKREVEEKKLLPLSQGGFKKGRKAINNIFILNYLMQREKKEKNKKVYAAFI